MAALAACGGDSSTASTTPNGRKQHLQGHKRPATPEAALEQLMAGNERYVQGKGIHKVDESVRRIAVAEEQKPYAAILGCADSRVPPEVIFDQGWAICSWCASPGTRRRTRSWSAASNTPRSTWAASC